MNRRKLAGALLAGVVLLAFGVQTMPGQAASQVTPGPSSNTPVNPKIVKGKAGSGFFDPTAPGYSSADPGVKAAQSSMALAAFTPAPYSSLRWSTSPEDANGHPWICIGNHIGTAWQDRVNAWNDVADQLTVTYQVGSNACNGWSNNDKMDIEAGYDTARACAYVYKAWNASGLLTRVIVYMNHGKAACVAGDLQNPTDDQILSTRHWKSQAIGLGLGNLQFGVNTPNPGFSSVMDLNIPSYSIPNPARGDGLTYDWYN